LLYFISKIVARFEETEVPCFMKNASASGSSAKSQMLPSCFRFQLLSSKCFRFHKNSIASTASVSSFCFHIPGLNRSKNVPLLVVIHKRRPQSGREEVCPVRTFCGQEGEGCFFRCGHPHFLAQKS